MDTINYDQFQKIVRAILDGLKPDNSIAIIPDCNMGEDEMRNYIKALPLDEVVDVDITLGYPVDQIPSLYDPEKTKLFYTVSSGFPGKLERPITCSKKTGVPFIFIASPDDKPEMYSNDCEVMSYTTDFDGRRFESAKRHCFDAITSLLYTRKHKGFVIFDKAIKILMKEKVYTVYAAGKPYVFPGFLICAQPQDSEVVKWIHMDYDSSSLLDIYPAIVKNIDYSMTKDEADEKLSKMINGL